MRNSAAQRLVDRTFQTGDAEQRIQAAQSIGMRIAHLALEYGKATDDATRYAIKYEAKRLMAQRDGIEYQVFEQEYAAFQAERRAA